MTDRRPDVLPQSEISSRSNRCRSDSSLRSAPWREKLFGTAATLITALWKPNAGFTRRAACCKPVSGAVACKRCSASFLILQDHSDSLWIKVHGESGVSVIDGTVQHC